MKNTGEFHPSCGHHFVYMGAGDSVVFTKDHLCGETTSFRNGRMQFRSTDKIWSGILIVAQAFFRIRDDLLENQ